MKITFLDGSVKEFEQGISNLINGIVKIINNSGTDYLNRAMQEDKQ